MYKTAKELFKSEYVSYSRLSCYEKCPQQFKLRYLDGLPCPVGKAAQLGKVVHAVIASYLNDIGLLVFRCFILIHTEILRFNICRFLTPDLNLKILLIRLFL